MAKDSLNTTGDEVRRELYERFRSELAEEDSSNIFFDEGDLIEIYDYAADLHDRFTALEALFCAARLYPSSAEFRERKAVFYLGIDDEAAVGAVAMLPDDSVIKSLATLRLSHSSPDEARPVLDAILRDHDELSDEEIIQMCDTAEELGMYEWLVTNKEAIKSRTDYPPTFLYELCQIAQEIDPDEALGILEELTMQEPFSIDFWLLMAQIHIEQGNPAKALPSIEYALAIEPANLRALMARAHVYNELDYPVAQTEAVLKEAIAVDPDLVSPYLGLALLQLQHGDRPDEAMRILRDYNARHPGNPQTLDIMLSAIESLPDDSFDDIDTFLPHSLNHYLDNFVDMARRKADEGKHRAAAILLLALDRAYHLTRDFDFLMEEAYRAGMYREAFDSYQAHFRQSGKVVQIVIDELNDCFAAFWFVLSAIRLGVTEGLAPLVGALLASEPVNSSRNSIDDILESRSLSGYLVKINAYLSGTDRLEIDSLDPFADAGASEH